MRIIYHHRTQLSDAQAIHIEAMVRAFRDLGHQVDVISLVGSSLSDRGPGRLCFGRIATSRLPSPIYETLSLGYNVYGYRQLARALRQGDVDLIYERYAPNACCGVLASRRFGVPLLLEINAPWHDHLPSGQPPRFRQIARRLERWVCSNSSRTIAVSATLKEHLVEQGVPERQVTAFRGKRCAGDTV
jgi:Glycosyltransferase Family 4